MGPNIETCSRNTDNRMWSILMLSLLVTRASSYSGGAPASVCEDLTPRHHTDPQEHPSPFTITASPNNIQPGEMVTVTISAPVDRNFRGFLVNARKVEDNSIFGSFVTDNELHKLIPCKDLSNSGVTHSSKVNKTKVEVSWLSPRDYQGQVVFRSAVVETGKKFWVNVSTPEYVTVSGQTSEAITTRYISHSDVSTVKINEMTTTTDDMTTTQSEAAAAPALQNSPFPDTYYGCKSTKGCFGGPKDCIQTQSCKLLTTFTYLNDSKLEIEILGDTTGYIALGFSADKLMGDDSVIACSLNGSNSRISVFHSWNVKGDQYNMVLENMQYALSDTSGFYEDGYLYCRFILDPIYEVKGQQYDLINSSYYLFLAKGRMESVQHPVQLDRHFPNPFVSGSEVRVTAMTDVNPASRPLVKIHGCLMIASWIATASIAIFLARYFKQTWTDTTHCGEKVWFSWHRALNILTILMSTAAFVVIFIEVQGWSQIWQKNPHPILGVITTALMWIQPIMAALRCHPGSPGRPVFNWLHFLVGNSAHIIAIATLFLATSLDKAELPDVYMWILIAFVAFHVIVFFTMEIVTCFQGNAKSSNQIAMKDFAANGNTYQMNENHHDAPGSSFRKFMLLLYVVGNLGFMIALVVTTAVSPIKEH